MQNLIHADDEDGPESVEDILGIGTLDQEPLKTEDNDIMHEDLRDVFLILKRIVHMRWKKR